MGATWARPALPGRPPFSGPLLAGPKIRGLKEVVSTPLPAASSVPPWEGLLGLGYRVPAQHRAQASCGVRSCWEEREGAGRTIRRWASLWAVSALSWLQSERSHDTHIFVLNPRPRRVRSRGGSRGAGPQLGGKGKSHAGVLKTVTLKYGVTTLGLPGRASPPLTRIGAGGEKPAHRAQAP